MMGYPTSVHIIFLNSVGIIGFDLDNLLKVAKMGYFFYLGKWK